MRFESAPNFSDETETSSVSENVELSTESSLDASANGSVVEPARTPEQGKLAEKERLDNALLAHFDRMVRVPLLTPEEEKYYARRMTDGATPEIREAARTKMIDANLRLVVNIANKYMSSGMEMVDLIQEGNRGLVIAVDRFDVELGNKLSTYATWWIRQVILREIVLQFPGRQMRLPEHISDKLGKLYGEMAKRAMAERRVVTPEEVAHDAEFRDGLPGHATSADALLKAHHAFQRPFEIDKPTHDDDEQGHSREMWRDALVVETEQEFMMRAREQAVARVMATADLSDKEVAVLRARYGLGEHGGVSSTLEELGKSMGVSRERVRQIEKTALSKLRKSRKSKRVLQSYRYD